MSNELTRANVSSLEHQYGVSTTDSIGGELAVTAEANTRQLEAQARALIQARFYIAKQPQMQRNWDTVEQRLRKECQRPGFAQAAWWILPLGGDSRKYPKGLSIRFAEAALRMAGNIDVQTQTVFDDQFKRIVRVTVLDLETNFAYTTEATIDKTVERRDAKDREILAVRENSEGKRVYVIQASEQEVALKQGSAVSKAIRTLGLRMIPGDILDECRAIIEATRQKGTQAEDPEAARKAILDNFATIGVMPDEIEVFLGHKTDILQPAERDVLRGAFRAIRDGNTTWQELMSDKDPSGSKEAAQSVAAAKLAALRKNTSTTKDGGGSSSAQVATAAESGETDSRQATGTAREIPPAYTPGPASAPVFCVRHRVAHRGKCPVCLANERE